MQSSCRCLARTLLIFLWSALQNDSPTHPHIYTDSNTVRKSDSFPKVAWHLSGKTVPMTISMPVKASVPKFLDIRLFLLDHGPCSNPSSGKTTRLNFGVKQNIIIMVGRSIGQMFRLDFAFFPSTYPVLPHVLE